MDGDAPRKYKKRKWPFPTFPRDTVGPRSVDGTAAHTVRLREAKIVAKSLETQQSVSPSSKTFLVKN